jgi:glutathione synthase/RimK-type ligase-like ATP-grasp enzyme
MLVVGVVVSAKKETELTNRGLFYTLEGETLQFVPIRTVNDLNHWIPKIVLSKITANIDPDLVHALENRSNIRHVCNAELQKVFTDRWAVIEKIWEGQCTFAPDSALITSAEDGIAEAFLREHEKVILKPESASGPKESHNMCIASTVSEVKKFLSSHSPAIIQQLVPHKDSFVKVFVIGDRIDIFVRKSLGTNLETGKSFNTQGMFNQPAETESLSPRIVDGLKVVAKEVTKLFQTALLGIDIVLETGCDKPIIVDVNFFPTYRELGAEFKSALSKYCRNLCLDE